MYIKKLGRFLVVLCFILLCSCGDKNEERDERYVFEERIPFDICEADFDGVIQDNKLTELEKSETIIEYTLFYSGETELREYEEASFKKGIEHVEKIYAEDAGWTELDNRVNLMGIHVLLKAFLNFGDDRYLVLAEKITNEIIAGEWLNNEERDFNNQLYASALLNEFSEISGNANYKKEGSILLRTLIDNIELYDSKTGLRENLVQERDLKFRFANPYTKSEVINLPIDKISLNNINGDALVLDIGHPEDSSFLNGQWGGDFEVNGHSVRAIEGEAGFCFSIPESWEKEIGGFYVLEITYYDEQPGNLTVEIQSEADEGDFKAICDGDLLLSGLDGWRTWKVPVRFSETGIKMDANSLKVASILLDMNSVAYDDIYIAKWADIIEGYYNLNYSETVPMIVKMEPVEYPAQTTPLAWQIKDGLLVQRLAGKETVMINGKWDGKSPAGELVISPYLIACQAKGEKITVFVNAKDYGVGAEEYDGLEWVNTENIKELKKETALEWLDKNKKEVGNGAYVWLSNADNAYNDIVTKAPWASSFFQRHVIDAYLENGRIEMARMAANAFQYSIEEGGLTSIYWKGGTWYEEVPNKTHILNAQMASIMALYHVWEDTGDLDIRRLFEEGIVNLEKQISNYDAGYWSIYDRNPQDELLLQMDWLEGDGPSLLIDKVMLVNTKTNTATCVDIGTKKDFEGYPCISGNDWGGAIENEDGRNGRTILNGHILRDESTEDGTIQNTFCVMPLPEREFDDYFDVPVHKLVITYKDVAAGTYKVKARSKNRADILYFEPLKNAEIVCVGDGKWKEKEILLFPQDLGWYMGYEYHEYHAEELARIAELADSWYLSQCAEKWQYYYEMWKKGEPVIRENLKNTKAVLTEVFVVRDIEANEDFGLENSLDGDWANDYTAASVFSLPQEFEIALQDAVPIDYIMLMWESADNYASDYYIEGINEEGEIVWTIEEHGKEGMQQGVSVNCNSNVKNIKFVVNGTHGEPRILLRQIRLLNKN